MDGNICLTVSLTDRFWFELKPIDPVARSIWITVAVSVSDSTHQMEVQVSLKLVRNSERMPEFASPNRQMNSMTAECMQHAMRFLHRQAKINLEEVLLATAFCGMVGGVVVRYSDEKDMGKPFHNIGCRPYFKVPGLITCTGLVLRMLRLYHMLRKW